MIFSFKYPKCGNTELAGPHKVHSSGRGLQVPHLKIDLSGSFSATFETYTCINCGYTEFYADKAGRINIRNHGHFLKKPEIYCKTCGVLITEELTFCNQCGSQIQ